MNLAVKLSELDLFQCASDFANCKCQVRAKMKTNYEQVARVLEMQSVH
jgi:hypothetical protein